MNLVEERLSRCLHDCVPDPPGSVLFEDVARRARQRRRRSSAAILVALAVVIGATLPAVLLARGAARSGPAVPANARTLPLTRVATWGSIRFGYPAAWRAEDFHIVSYGPTSFGPYLSNQPMRNPCATRLAGTEISCGSPLSRLRPDGVLVTWLAGPSRAGLRGPPVPGTVVLTVDGHPASISVQAPDRTCAAEGGTESFNAWIDEPPPGGAVALLACYRPSGPGLTATLRAIVLSVRFSPVTVQVPNVLGLSYATALRTLTAAGFAVTRVFEPGSTAPPGVVLAESPDAGSVVPVGTTIRLTGSPGPAG